METLTEDRLAECLDSVQLALEVIRCRMPVMQDELQQRLQAAKERLERSETARQFLRYGRLVRVTGPDPGSGGAVAW